MLLVSGGLGLIYGEPNVLAIENKALDKSPEQSRGLRDEAVSARYDDQLFPAANAVHESCDDSVNRKHFPDALIRVGLHGLPAGALRLCCGHRCRKRGRMRRTNANSVVLELQPHAVA
ncbi:hypothetical protein D9M70_364640 [compost metagenome]